LGPVIGVIAGLCLCSPGAFAQTTDRDAPRAAPGGSAKNGKDAQLRFNILEYVVDGNTALPVPVIEEAVYPFLGEQKTAGDVDRAREALEHAYQSRGYQTVQVYIPQQGVESGTIHLQVVENPVGRLRVVNSAYHSLQMIKATAPSIAEGKVPNMKELRDDIIALNQQPDMRVTPRLKAGRAPGTVDVDLEVQDSLPLHGSVEVNNQNNQDTTPLRTVGTVSYDNLWQLGHSVALSYQVAPERPSDAQVFSGTYLFKIPRTPLAFLIYGVKSDSNVAALAGTLVVGKGNIVGARAIVTLPGTDTFYHSITAGIDRKDLLQNVITAGVESRAPVLYYPISIAYAATEQEKNEITQFNASLNFAVPGVGSGSLEFDPQRFDALRQYIYLKMTASRVQPLPWGMSLFGKFEGQITNDPLLSSEQFSVGGANSVRGYLEAEELGDYGALGTIELRSPSFGQDISSKIEDWHLLAFFDGAAAYIRDPLEEQQSAFHLAGAGVGMRLTALNAINAALDVAIPLTDAAETKKGDVRLHFLVSSAF
jgi:hemolysin activation/secretion protein